MTHKLPSSRAVIGCKASDELVQAPSSKSVPVMVVLGSPSSQCQGQGICYIQEAAYGAVSVSACQRTMAQASLGANGILLLQFNLRDICPGALGKHFRAATLRVGEEAPVHIPALQCIGCQVPKGNYRIRNQDGVILLEIPLSNKA